MHRTGVEPMSTAWKAAWYATTTPTMLGRLTIEEIKFINFRILFFPYKFSEGHIKKNQNYSLRSGVVFSLPRQSFFSWIKSCYFLFVTCQGHWDVKKRQDFTISWSFCPSNAHNSNVQFFPDNKYTFTGPLSLCIARDLNPCQQLGRLLCYHYTNAAEKVNDQRDEIQNFQTWNFPSTFSECHIKKNQNYSLKSGVVFSLIRLNCFSLIESCCFWFVTSRGLWEFKKRQEFTLSWLICPSNAYNNNVQSFPENKYSFTGRLSLCIVRESNRCQQLGRLLAMLPLHQRCWEGLRSKK